jgi:hypothetical protein
VGISSGFDEDRLSIPPDDEVDPKRNYYYTPIPMDVPPVPSNIFLHELTKDPILHRSTTWMSRLPKKLNNSIFSTVNEVEWGWGVHIVEGYNAKALGGAVLLGLIASYIAGSLYWGLAGDIQGGTGLGSWLLTGLGVLIGCSAFMQQI